MADGASRLFLRKALGRLRIDEAASTPTYEAYFHIPIAFEGQVPLLLTVKSPALVDYRFVRISPPNVIVAARMRSAGSTQIDWESWVLVQGQDPSFLPARAPIPTTAALDPSLRPWLQPTECVQWEDPFIKAWAERIRPRSENVLELARTATATCLGLPGPFLRNPWAWDAYYALNWGNSCTGLAHAGAALLRANGVPTRVLLNMTTSPEAYARWVDQHWIAQFHVPGQGWVRTETTTGYLPTPPQWELVTMACAPEDEFPLFGAQGIEGHWHTSDPGISPRYPKWSSAHMGLEEGTLLTTPERAAQALRAVGEVFHLEVDRRGATLPGRAAAMDAVQARQREALDRLRKVDMEGFLAVTDQAKGLLQAMPLLPEQTIFSEDFEGSVPGWTHGGLQDTWRLGQPSGRPARAHSGTSCFGTGFEGGYKPGTDSWLLSPPFDLRGYSEATLDCWIYNWLQNNPYNYSLQDSLFMEATTDGGRTFLPLCSRMGGVNQDAGIPKVGGWAHLHLDLTRFLGQAQVQVRFRMQGTSKASLPGSFIDDLRVVGRPVR